MRASIKVALSLLFVVGSITSAFSQIADIDKQINRHKLGHNIAVSELDYGKAIQHWSEVTRLSREKFGQWHMNYAIELAKLGRLYSNIAEYGQARDCYTQAFEIMERSGHQNDKNYASMLNDMVSWCYEMGDDTTAEYYLQKQQTLIAQIGDIETDPTLLYNRGLSYYKRDSLDQALAYYNKALKYVAQRTTNHAVILSAIGSIYGDKNEKDKAVVNYEEASDILLENLDRDHRAPKIYARISLNLSTEYINMGEYRLATEWLKRTAKYQEKLFGKEHPDYTRTLNAMIQASRVMNTIDPIRVTELYNNCRNEIRKNFQFLPENQRESNIHNIYDEFFNTLYTVTTHRTTQNMPQMAKLMYNTALLAKGLLLSTSIEFKQMIEESGNPDLLSKYQELNELHTMINAEKQKPLANRNPDIANIEQRAHTIEAELMQEVKAVGDYTRNLDLTWEDIAQSPYIGNNDVAVEFVDYYDGDREYAAVVLRKGWTTPKVYHLCTENELKELIGATATTVSGGATNSMDQIHNGVYENDALYRRIWEPIKEEIKSGDRIFFSPSGLLHSIALEYLPTNKKSTIRMCDTYRMFRCSSTRHIAIVNHQSGSPTAHLYGDISYHLNETDMQFYYNNISNNIDRFRGVDTEGYRSGLRSVSRPSNTFWTQLEGTRKEIAEIEPLLESSKNIKLDVKTHTKADASEQSIKAISGQKSKIVHIATHGYYNKQNNSSNKEHSNALSRSALIFAGAGNEELFEGMDDGYLTAEEISLLDLRGTELVVLSACQSGKGESSSAEGLDGLQRAFKKAGVHTLIVSLWDVSDLVTQEIMVAFYKNYSDGYNWRTSFENALKDIRRNKAYKSPKYWAPFVMID